MARALALAALLACLCAVSAQPFTTNPLALTSDLSEAEQRVQSNYEGFTFDFNRAKAVTKPPNGMIQQDLVSTNPFLSTAEGAGSGQVLVTLGPCSTNPPHVHPRGGEDAFVLEGHLEFGMVEENAAGNVLVERKVMKHTTVHIPKGVLHWAYNPTCMPAVFLASFATKDPGTQVMWKSMFTVPTHVLEAASGLSAEAIEDIKAKGFLMAPSSGGRECMERCGIDTTLMNKAARSS